MCAGLRRRLTAALLITIITIATIITIITIITTHSM
jgi:hypothetical protein